MRGRARRSRGDDLRARREVLDERDRLHALLDDRVGRRGARGDGDLDGAVERQEVLLDQDLAVDGAVGDRVVGLDARSLVDVEAAEPLLVRDLEEVRRVRRVPAADDEDEVESLG